MPTPAAKPDEIEVGQISAAPRARAWYKHLSFQILLAMILGVFVGHVWPQSADSLKPLGDLFIKLVRMLVAPIIFCTVVHGIASVGEAKKVGRVAIKSLIYFEVVTTIALILALLLVNLLGARRRHACGFENPRRHRREGACKDRSLSASSC